MFEVGLSLQRSRTRNELHGGPVTSCHVLQCPFWLGLGTRAARKNRNDDIYMAHNHVKIVIKHFQIFCKALRGGGGRKVANFVFFIDGP